MTTSYDLSREVVAKVGGDPDNASIVKAVAIWLRWESGSTVTGNNPWNIRGVGACGQHAFGTNTGFATYCTQAEGTSATASLITRRYPGIASAIRAGDGRAFFTALFASPWSAGHYLSGQSQMLAQWSGSFGANTTLTIRSVTNAPVIPIGQLASVPPPKVALVWGIPEGKILTNSDIDGLIRALQAAGVLKYQAPGTAEVTAILRGSVGKPWNGATRGALQTLLRAKADQQFTWGDVEKAAEPLAEAVAGAGKVVAFFFDTENWTYIAALAIGVPLSIFGFYLLAGVPTGGQNA